MEIAIDETTLRRYLKTGSNGPKSSKIRKALYEKIKNDFGYATFSEEENERPSGDLFVEDREKKVSLFCKEKLEEAFNNICIYITLAYNGKYSLLFEKDFSDLLFLFAIYKPCAPNYLCSAIQRFFQAEIISIKEEAINNGMIIFEDVGFWYQYMLKEGEVATVEDCELAEDYIENNIEEHRERVRKFWYDIVDFWCEYVECVYPDGMTGNASKVREKIKNSPNEIVLTV